MSYNFISVDGAASMRTNDVDMLLSPHAVDDEVVDVPARIVHAPKGKDFDLAEP